MKWLNLIRGLNYAKGLFEDKDCKTPIDMTQYEIMRKAFTEEFITDLVSKGLLVKVEKRKNFTIQKRLELFFKANFMIRVNGLVRRVDGREEWFNPNDKDRLYQQYNILQFFQIDKNIDHIKSLRGGNSNDDDNLELTTSEFNKFKSDSVLIK